MLVSLAVCNDILQNPEILFRFFEPLEAYLPGVHSKCPDSTGFGSWCPPYNLVSIFGIVYYLLDILKYLRDALTHIAVLYT